MYVCMYERYSFLSRGYPEAAEGAMTTADVYVVFLNRYKIIHKLGCWMVESVGLLNGWVHVVLTLTHRYNNAVRGHRTRSNNSGAEDYLRRKNK